MAVARASRVTRRGSRVCTTTPAWLIMRPSGQAEREGSSVVRWSDAARHAWRFGSVCEQVGAVRKNQQHHDRSPTAHGAPAEGRR